MKKSFIFALAMLFLVVNGVLVSAITGSMGNAKMILYPEVNGWTNTVIEKTILTKNVNNVSINVTLQLDQNATKFIELIDKSYILAPGENKTAQFEVKVKKEGTYQGKINVFFSPADGKGPGVVLSSVVTVIAKKNQDYTDMPNTNDSNTGDVISDNENGGQGIPRLFLFWGIGTAVLVIILLLLLYVWNKKRNKNKIRKNKFKWERN